MQRHYLCLLLVVCLGNSMTVPGACALNSDNNNSSIACCDLLDLLGKYTIHDSGDRVPTSKCTQNQKKCLSLNLVKLFLKQTNSFLEQKSPGDGVHTNEKDIVIHHDTIFNNVPELIVFAFLGHSVATHRGLFDEHLSIEYDSILDKLTLRDSACAVNKTIYSTIVGASISLIVFFIVMQIIEEQKKIKREDVVEGDGRMLSVMNDEKFRMVGSPNLQRLLKIRPLQYHAGRGQP